MLFLFSLGSGLITILDFKSCEKSNGCHASHIADVLRCGQQSGSAQVHNPLLSNTEFFLHTKVEFKSLVCCSPQTVSVVWITFSQGPLHVHNCHYDEEIRGTELFHPVDRCSIGCLHHGRRARLLGRAEMRRTAASIT